MNTRTKRSFDPEETRHRLLDSGLELFGLHGFQGVTTRQLATHAGVNQAAIPYHFGGKEGLYIAVAKRIIDNMDALLDAVQREAVGGFNAAGADREKLASMLVLLVRTMTGRMTVDPRRVYERAFIIREYAVPGKAFETIFKGGVERLHSMVTSVVAAAMGLEPESEEAVVYAHTVMGQVMGFAVGKAVLCRRLARDDYDDELRDTIADVAAKMALRATGLDDVDPAKGTAGSEHENS